MLILFSELYDIAQFMFGFGIGCQLRVVSCQLPEIRVEVLVVRNQLWVVGNQFSDISLQHWGISENAKLPS